MEFLDIYDENGKHLGVKSREECHSANPGYFHKPVWIWIINGGGGILVQKRAKTKKKSPGLWDMPSAGHVDAGETMLQACVRETYEEIGVKTQESDFIFLKEWVNYRGWELAQIYLLRLDVDIKDMTLQESEVEEVKWLTYDEFVELLFSDKFCGHAIDYKEWVAKILKEATKQ